MVFLGESVIVQLDLPQLLILKESGTITGVCQAIVPSHMITNFLPRRNLICHARILTNSN